MDSCPACIDTQKRMCADGKSNDEAYRKAMREHADGKHPAIDEPTKPGKSSR